MLYAKLIRLAVICALAVLLAQPAFSQTKGAPSRADILKVMKRATTYMTDTVSYRGGFVWNYAPDLSRRWGEFEAKSTMIWMEPPGTPAMGHLFLDAYHATGDEFYYKAAERTAQALIWAQLPCGGWNYNADFAGEASLKDWYRIENEGYNWPAREYMYYYGNATFDDGGTIQAAELLLRMYIEKYDPKFKPALDRAIDFVLESQYPIGGWPQRYPLRYDHPDGGPDDYSSFITINDGVHTNNIDFLILCYQTLGEQRVIEPITRAMTCILALQGGDPQAGWGLQHSLDLDLSPAHARPFEPAGYASHGTQEMIRDLFYFYRLTGNTKYIARIPEAFAWLESIRIPESDYHYFEPRRLPQGPADILCPSFVEIGTNRGLYLHLTDPPKATRHYYVDYDMTQNILAHYSSVRVIQLAKMKREYEELLSTPVEELLKDSPLKNTGLVKPPKYFSQYRPLRTPTPEQLSALFTELNAKGYWAGRVPDPASEYIGLGPNRVPTEVISSMVYIRNMMTLIALLDPEAN